MNIERASFVAASLFMCGTNVINPPNKYLLIDNLNIIKNETFFS